MWILLLIFVLFSATLMLTTYVYRKKKNIESTVSSEIADDCCGAHEVCERDSLLNKNGEIVYYDDEDLNLLAKISPADYSSEQIRQLSDVFYTLQEKDVAGWLRSLQMRQIELPEELREEALLVVAERRFHQH